MPSALLTPLSYLAFALLLPFLWLHPKLREGIRARLGHHPRGLLPPGGGPRVWMHGASAGDVLALMPTVRALRAVRPDVQVIVTTITNSGRAIAARHAELLAAVTYCPYDVPGAVARSLDALRPDVLVLEYTELWPQLIAAARRRGVRLVLHNGRLAQSRLRRYRWLFKLTGNLLRAFDVLLMRNEAEAERARQLGALPARVQVTGNTKFDSLGAPPPPAQVAALRAALAAPDAAPVWVAGSTHEGEEERLLATFVALRRGHPQLRMVLAPRYVERAERLAREVARLGLRPRLRSAAGRDACDVLVLDTFGELTACYALATVVFVGGSFVPRGGQNILEPAACGRPVLFGPSMQNFADAVQVLLGRGGIQVSSVGQLQRVLADLLARPAERAALGATARAQVTAVRGAAERNAAQIGLCLAPLG